VAPVLEPGDTGTGGPNRLSRAAPALEPGAGRTEGSTTSPRRSATAGYSERHEPPANSLDIHIVLGQFFEVVRLAGFANGERFGHTVEEGRTLGH